MLTMAIAKVKTMFFGHCWKLEYSGTGDYFGSCFTAKVLKAPMTFQMGQKFDFLMKKQTTY